MGLTGQFILAPALATVQGPCADDRWRVRSDRSGTADKCEAGDGDDADEDSKIAKGFSLELSRVDGSREQSSGAVRDEGQKWHSCFGAGRPEGRPAGEHYEECEPGSKEAGT